MKSASIVSIILAVILIIIGVVICIIAGSMAEKQEGVYLYADRMSPDGDAINDYSLDGKNLNAISIDLKRANVNVIGNSDKSRVEVVDYPSKAYDYWVGDGTVHFKDATPLSLFTNIRISESGFGFTGLRHYLNLGAYKDKPRVINIYLAKGEILASTDIKIGTGYVTVTDVSSVATCNVTVENGNLTATNVISDGKATLNVANGDVELVHCRIREAVCAITEKGDLVSKIDFQHSLTLKCLGGTVFFDGEDKGAEFSGVYPSKPVELAPEPAQTESETPAEGEAAAPDAEKPAEGGEGESDGKPDDKTPASEFPMILKADVKIGDIKISVE